MSEGRPFTSYSATELRKELDQSQQCPYNMRQLRGMRKDRLVALASQYLALEMSDLSDSRPNSSTPTRDYVAVNLGQDFDDDDEQQGACGGYEPLQDGSGNSVNPGDNQGYDPRCGGWSGRRWAAVGVGALIGAGAIAGIVASTSSSETSEPEADIAPARRWTTMASTVDYNEYGDGWTPYPGGDMPEYDDGETWQSDEHDNSTQHYSDGSNYFDTTEVPYDGGPFFPPEGEDPVEDLTASVFRWDPHGNR